MNALVNIVKTDAAAALKTTLVVKVVLVVTDLFISYKKKPLPFGAALLFIVCFPINWKH